VRCHSEDYTVETAVQSRVSRRAAVREASGFAVVSGTWRMPRIHVAL